MYDCVLYMFTKILFRKQKKNDLYTIFSVFAEVFGIFSDSKFQRVEPTYRFWDFGIISVRDS